MSAIKLDATESPTEFEVLASPQLAPPVDWTRMRPSEHFVQFYEEDDFLTRSIAAFTAAGLNQGEAAIIIATEPHRDAICEALCREGINVEKAQALGNLVLLDAAKTLD